MVKLQLVEDFFLVIDSISHLSEWNSIFQLAFQSHSRSKSFWRITSYYHSWLPYRSWRRQQTVGQLMIAFLLYYWYKTERGTAQRPISAELPRRHLILPMLYLQQPLSACGYSRILVSIGWCHHPLHNIGCGGKLNGYLMASCVKNIFVKNC